MIQHDLNLFRTHRPVKYLLLSMYIAGVIGLNLEISAPLFKFLTPFNLLFSALVLFYLQADKSKPFLFFAGITFLIGFFIEVIGVHTGLIFGKYAYQTTLGFKVWDVPLVIGLNWFVLSCSIGFLVHTVFKKTAIPYYLKALFAALLMTALDYVIEPIAIKHEMWTWFGQTPPLSNYYGWLGTAFVIQLIYFYAPFRKENPVAVWLLALQVVFFGIQWLF